ncbi:hypothetical protein JW721_03515 [Candidatus Micrarchaeota archaeon]|nr:hypothetical protein [Candidatus Micrarchaeota archaeon]
MAEFAIPIHKDTQEGNLRGPATSMQEVPAALDDAQAAPKALSPVELLTLFCQNPPSMDCLPAKKGILLAEETVKLNRALKFFIGTGRAEPLLAELNKDKLDITILYFAARLWGNPETGMEVCKELGKTPPKSSAGKLLHTLLKPLSEKASFNFWSSLGETPPMEVSRKLRMNKPQPQKQVRKPLLKAV